ncbi:hypothetical protein AKJ66_03290 [candidate division MSBL1 archaeon SCGC-AAA259E22]|uniref:MobA-like NTP transferase domain-containing protein n=2 Tax=candidate division MSBL1 TaxID=215777 RepID=A0A133V5U2_9EURY|nr:hypothetical protein AKJ66_03290 [candidate division MSBL1 archaeon SCGC-AAA259E22]KXB01811.1 hypothetical protein AKJ41_00095 [candidate division MSBL1 archaeon SCGC-AAA259O05]
MERKIAGVLMAGGGGIRMEHEKEKPLVPLAGKPLLEYVFDALRDLEGIDRTVIAASPKAPKTADYAKRLPAEVVVTPGDGYSMDWKAAIDEVNCDIGLIVPSDLPLVTTGILGEVLDRFKEAGKPALSVYVPVGLVEDFGLTPDMKYRVCGEDVVPAGINVIKNPNSKDAHLEQEDFILPRRELGLNVNDRKSLRVADELISQRRSCCQL